MGKIVGHVQKIALAAVAMVILIGLGGRQLMAASEIVGSCGTGTSFATIQAAVDAAPAGSSILICPGNYPEQVVINKNLSLKGSQVNTVLVKPAGGFVANTTSLTSGDPIAAQILVQSPATAVILSYLTVDGTGNNLDSGCSDPRLIGIYYQNASGLLAFAVVRNQAQGAANFGCNSSAGLGIFVQSSGTSTPSTVNIRDSAVYGFQKNGITANEAGTTVTVFGDSMIGAGPTIIAQNGVQIAYGATGTIQNSVVADNVFNGDPSAGIASGILVFDSGNVGIYGNSVNDTQGGIVIQTDGTLPADHNKVQGNSVMNTQLGDGVDVCSNNNKIASNNIYTSGQSGIHLDTTCGSTGNSNLVELNVVNEACAGILLGSGTGNTIMGNTIASVDFIGLAGDTCTTVMPPAARAKREVSAHGHAASPARP
jgi:hypothetical protein